PASNTKTDGLAARLFGVWNLRFGRCLMFGLWCFRSRLIQSQTALTRTVSTTFRMYPAGFHSASIGCDWPMRLVAFTFNSQAPARGGRKEIVHSRKEYLP